MLRDLEVVRLDKRIEGLDFLRGLLGPNSVGLMKGKRARERRQLLHNVRKGLSGSQELSSWVLAAWLGFVGKRENQSMRAINQSTITRPASILNAHTYTYIPQLFTTQKLDALVPHFVRCIRRDVATWGEGGAEFEVR